MLEIKKNKDEVTPEKILSYLSDNTHLIATWLEWSADKRWTPAWYFTDHGDGWVVGYYPNGPEFAFEDSVHACAHFVEMEFNEVVSW